VKVKLVAIAVAALVVIAVPVRGEPVRAQLSGSGWGPQQAPGFYRFRLGAFRITVLSDGTAPRDLPQLMSKPGEVRRAFAAAHQALPTEISINCFLVDTGEKRILVDTGAGELFGPIAGQLVTNLRAANYHPEDIDIILLTHIHGDHSGGLSVGGKRVFPNATVFVDRRDADYWLNEMNEANAIPSRKRSFVQARETVGPYLQAERLKTFDGSKELFPGIRSILEHGHTPGLTGYLFESQGHAILLWGDVVHSVETQLRDPTITIEYDVDPREAIVSRKKILSEAAKRGYLIGAAHISFPGIGHIRTEKVGFSWVPAPYSVLLQDHSHQRDMGSSE
jgi:glyoxylase-like metal-dependent hydrolase (beta-lactamase superfamily II)